MIDSYNDFIHIESKEKKLPLLIHTLALSITDTYRHKNFNNDDNDNSDDGDDYNSDIDD